MEAGGAGAGAGSAVVWLSGAVLRQKPKGSRVDGCDLPAAALSFLGYCS